MKRLVFCAMALGLSFLFACGDGNGDGDAGQDPAGDPVLDEVGETPTDPAPDDGTGDPSQDPPHEDPGTDPPPDSDAADAADAPGCDVECMEGLTCCDGRCVNLNHDPDHCSACNSPCNEAAPYCNYGTCETPPCDTECTGPTECCGTNCCNPGQICCIVEGGPIGPPTCHDDVCPGGCPLCP